MAANYIEYVVLPERASQIQSNGNGSNVQLLSYDLTEEEFTGKMKPLLARNIKFYERRLKYYVKENLMYEVVLDHNDDISDIRSYVKTALDYKFLQDGRILEVHYNKNKKPIHTFSSSHDMHDVSYIRRLTFRVSNRIFVNFDVALSVDDDTAAPHRKVFINANIDQNVDRDYIDSELQQYLGILSA